MSFFYNFDETINKVEHFLKQFLVNIPILHPPENLWFSGVFR